MLTIKFNYFIGNKQWLTKKNSVLIINQRYGQPLTHFQEAEAKAHREIGGIVNIRKNVRDTDRPLYEYVQLRENLFGRTDPQEEVPTGMRGYIDGKGFFDGTETA